MNIEEYRAMVAQDAQEKQQAQSQGETPNVQAQQSAPAITEPPVQEETKIPDVADTEGTQAETTNPPEQTIPEYVEIGGQQVPFDELKNGYLRQSDYTSKTQELAREKERLKAAEQLHAAVNSKPDFAKELHDSFGLQYMDPADARYEDLNAKYHEVLLNQEIATLESRYTDFDAAKVVSLAHEKGITSLEDAYHLYNAKNAQGGAPVDIAAITEQIRQSVLKELQSEVDTSTIISAGGDASSITQTQPELSAQEQKVARGLKLSDEEYLKFKKKR